MKNFKSLFLALAIFVSAGLIFDGSVFAKSSGGGGGGGGGHSSGGSVSSSRSSGGSSSSSWGSKSTPTTPTQTAQPSGSAGKSTSWGEKTGTSTSTANATTTSNRSTIMTQQKASNLKAQAAETKNFTSKTSSTDWKASQKKYSTGKAAYTPKVGTHTQDTNTRTVVYNRYYNSGPGGYAYADPFNHNMIFMFSTMWWYHNWNQIDRELYKDDIRMKELEKEIEKLKAQNIKVDPKYRDSGMDEAVMYNEGYLQAVKNGKISEATYVADKHEEEKPWYGCFISTLTD